jgi:GntR family transcriptional regulator
MEIDRNHQKPLHSQLTEVMRERIQTGFYPVESKLPSEREICEEFNVSRTTVRETIRQLIREDLVNVQAGRGAFVKKPNRNISVNVSLNGFSNDLIKSGKTPSSRLLSLEVVTQPKEEFAQAMKLEPGDELIKIERLRLVNNVPLAIHLVLVNHRFCPKILEYNLAQISLFRILRDVFHLKIDRATQEVFASLSNERERELLALPEPSAVLHEYRTTYLDTGEIIEYSSATYCGDFYHLLINLDATEKIFKGE